METVHAVEGMQHTYMIYYTFDFVGLQPSNPMQTKFRCNLRKLRQGYLSPVFANIQDLEVFELVNHRRSHRFGHGDQSGRWRIFKAIFVQILQNQLNIPGKHLRRHIAQKRRISKGLRHLEPFFLIT